MNYSKKIDRVQIVYNGNAVIFSDEAEIIFKSQGMSCKAGQKGKETAARV